MPAIARIPADLRNREDLSVGKVNRIVALRKRKEVLKKQLDAAYGKVELLQADIAANDKELDELVAAPPPLFPDQHPANQE